MAKKYLDWYQHLVNQSKHDGIYSLIHNDISGNWERSHDLDFVVVRKSNLPIKFTGAIPNNQIAKSLDQKDYCFSANDYVLLDNYCLTEYLDLATKMHTIEDSEGREFIELTFNPYIKDTDLNEVDSENIEIDLSFILQIIPENIANKEEALYYAYQLLRHGEAPSLALRFAKIGEQFLDNKPVLINENIDNGLKEIRQIMVGYNIVAMVYTWNNLFDDAAIIDDYYIRHPYIWDILGDYLCPYLVMLMAKKRVKYLNYLFKDLDFKSKFMAHYEAYISLFINPRYQLTKMQDVVGIINSVNNCIENYR